VQPPLSPCSLHELAQRTVDLPTDGNGVVCVVDSDGIVLRDVMRVVVHRRGMRGS
jgi:hypothetical protein